MAHTINRFKILDGPGHVVLHCFMKSDGVSGDLTNFTLLSPDDDVNPAMPHRQNFIVKKVWYEVGGFNITFSFGGATQNWPFWTLTPGVDSEHDWTYFGGIRDNSSMPLYVSRDNPGYLSNIPQGSPINSDVGGINASGALLMSTTGFTSATCSGAFVLLLEKRDRPDPQPG